MRDGLILFAHGSREAAWSRPMEMLRDRLASGLPDWAVVLAYLELGAPSFPEAIAGLAAQGVSRIRVLPLFLGQGAHTLRDLPRLAQLARERNPGMTIEVLPALGDDPAIVEALARALAEKFA